VDTLTLKGLLKQEMGKYAGVGANNIVYLTMSEDGQTYAIVAIGHFQGKRIVDTFLVARVVEDRIEIECDYTKRTLAYALQKAGVPAAQIVVHGRAGNTETHPPVLATP
jgi:uncharacterized SAM-binding protein YcdF (DUF218 family)